MTTTEIRTSVYTEHPTFDGTETVAHVDPKCDLIRHGVPTVAGSEITECPYCIGGRDAGWLGRPDRLPAQVAEEYVAPARTFGESDGSGRKGTLVHEMASEKQIGFLRKLHTERGIEIPTDLDTITKRAASALIETLLATPVSPAAPAQNVRPNRYAGRCVRCGATVGEGAGTIEKNAAGRWDVLHVGTCPATETTPEAPAATVPDGHYAIASTGDNDLVFYRVDNVTEGRYAGRVFVKMIVGGHPDSNVRQAAVAGILARIAADPEAAARYGQEIGRCHRCNRTLTDETSRQLGIGPDCRSRA